MENFTTLQKLQEIRSKIEVARKLSPLAAESPFILAASKGRSAAEIVGLIQEGIVNFGENRVQEAAEKWPEIIAEIIKAHKEVRLHLIGHLQSNKAKEALQLFDVIQTLDRKELAAEIAKIIASGKHNIKTSEFYIQINSGQEAQKSGIAPQEAANFIRYCRELKLNISGLMCIPPVGQMPAPHFALLRKIALDNNLHKLSMGMSGDYETAIRMGSTCVRIGTALFGERQRFNHIHRADVQP